MNLPLSLLVPIALAVLSSQSAAPSPAPAPVPVPVPVPVPDHDAAPTDGTPIGIQPAGAPLAALAPKADPEVLRLALDAVHCAQASGVATQAQRLAVIDYSRPSLQPRLWVFDLANQELLYHEVVAHGQGSGGNVPTRFSNLGGSHASSLGLFVTGGTYIGRNGYSLRMDGLERGINDAAMSRAIVIHGADYVDPVAGQRMGRLGRSWGCPALRNETARPIIDVLKDGQFVFSYYPDREWLARSALLHCPATGPTVGATAPRGDDTSG